MMKIKIEINRGAACVIYFWLDANAIAKRYVVEKGTPLINHFFIRVSAERIICLFDSMDETRSVIVRKRE